MTTNQYFNHTTNLPEQDLFNSLVVESIKIHGVDVLYIKRDIPELDLVLQEPKYSEFNDTFVIEMYPPSGGNNSHEGISMSKFGFLIDNTIEFVVSKTRWENEITRDDVTLNRPREGDLMFVGNQGNINNSYINTIFEITKVRVGNETKFEFGTNYVYTLTCKVYTPSHDEFDTQDDDLNDWLNDNTHKTEINEIIGLEQNDVVIPSGNPFGEL